MANGLANSLRFTHPEYTEQYHHSFGDMFVLNQSPVSPFSSLLSHTHSWGTYLAFLAAKCSFISTSSLLIVTGYNLVLCCIISDTSRVKNSWNQKHESGESDPKQQSCGRENQNNEVIDA